LGYCGHLNCAYRLLPTVPSPHFRHPAAFFAAVLFLISGGSALFAQQGSAVYSLPEPSSVTPSQAQVLQQPAVQSPAGSTDAEVSPNGQPVSPTERRFHYELSGTLRGIWDDNIYNSSFNKKSDFYFAIEPSIILSLGNVGEGHNGLVFTYQPSFFIFLDNSTNDTTQHLIRLAGSRQFGHLSLSLAGDVRLLDGTDLNSLSDPTGHQANLDVQGRNRHQVYEAQLGGSYDLTGKLFLSGGGTFSADEYSEPLISSQNFGGNLYLNYIYSDKLTVGVGTNGGINTVSSGGGGDQFFEQANVRLSYAATGKIGVSATAGAEFRQFEDNSGTEVNPVFALSAGYSPFDGTSIALSGSSQIYNSASFAGQDYTETTINLSVSQRLLQRFILGLAVGYTNTNYFQAVQGISAIRNDDFYYVSPSIDFNVTRYWTLGAYYTHREDSSNLPFFGFVDNQVGFRTKLTF
jgi:hypothetical protein